MNKMNALILTGLVFCGVNNASVMGQDQKEILYILHKLEQDFAQVPMITQNIDMFMGVMEMDIQLKELELKTATKELKTALWKNVVSLIGMAGVKSVAVNAIHLIDNNMAYGHFIKDIFGNGILLSTITTQSIMASNIYDVWKKRSELIQALALDKEILSKLQEIKASMDFIEQNADSEGKILLKNAE